MFMDIVIPAIFGVEFLAFILIVILNWNKPASDGSNSAVRFILDKMSWFYFSRVPVYLILVFITSYDGFVLLIGAWVVTLMYLIAMTVDSM